MFSLLSQLILIRKIGLRFLLCFVTGVGLAHISSAQAVWVSDYSAAYESVAFTPDGKYVLGGSGKWNYNGEIHMFEVRTGDLIRSFVGHQGPIIWEGHRHEIKLAVSPDGELLASSSQSNIIRLWDVKTGVQHPKILTDNRRLFGVQDLKFIPDGTGVLLLANNAIKLIDVGTGGTIWKYSISGGCPVAVDISPDGTTVAVGFGIVYVSGCHNRPIVLLDITTGQEIQRLENRVFPYESSGYGIAFSPDGTKLAVTADLLNNYGFNIWDLATGEELRRFFVPECFRREVLHRSLVFSADG